MKNRNLVGDIEIHKLISYKWFRTVDDTECSGSPSEYLIHIDLKDEFRNSLSFKTPFHGNLYAYAFVTEEFNKVINTYNFTQNGVKVDLVDWDDRFVISFEENHVEVQFFCNKDDVRYILEHCIRTPEQRIKK